MTRREALKLTEQGSRFPGIRSALSLRFLDIAFSTGKRGTHRAHISSESRCHFHGFCAGGFDFSIDSAAAELGDPKMLINRRRIQPPTMLRQSRNRFASERSSPKPTAISKSATKG